MALKPTIYKMKIELSDLNRNYYDTLHLTIARHPSETLERMMARVMAFSLNAQEYLEFTPGLSSPDDPDLWARALDGNISLWIDVGEPNINRIKKATRLASAVKVYPFNSKSTVWWKQGKGELSKINASVFQLHWAEIQGLAQLVDRTMDLSITVTEDSAYVSTEKGERHVSWIPLQVV